MNKNQALEILNTEVGVACLTNPHLVGMLSDHIKFSGYFDAADSDYEKHAKYTAALGIKNPIVPRKCCEVLEALAALKSAAEQCTQEAVDVIQRGEVLSALRSAAEQCIPEAADVIRRDITKLVANQ